MLSKAAALEILAQARLAPPKAESVALEAAFGRVLAEDVTSDMDMPPFNRSAMDGYAVRAADLAALPVDLDLQETIQAGSVPSRPVLAGQASRIMTGAPVPDGADCVIQVEWTEPAGDRVRIMRGSPAGANISRRGEDTRRGDTVLRRGTPLRPQDVGVLAGVGRATPAVWRRPSVGVAATGDELIELGAGIPGPGQIRESNMSMLVSQVRSIGLGLECEALGIVRDDRAALQRLFDRGLANDVLILSGGVSVGDFDFVPTELKARGLQVMIETVAMRPGKPLLFGKMSNTAAGITWVFGLPGNPVSSFCTFLLFVRPFLRRLAGYPGPHTLEWRARVVEPVLAKPMDRVQHLPARLEWADGEWVVTAVPWHGSGDLRAMLDANAFIVVAENSAPPMAGDMAAVVPFEPEVARLPPFKSR